MRELYDFRLESSGAHSLSAPVPGMRGVSPSPPWVELLARFYARTGLPLPEFVPLKNDEVPQPYKELLVHSADMTPTLENFFRQTLALTVLSRELEGDSYFREVVLCLAGDGHAVEYGAIRIFLAQFPAHARRHVLEEHSPLGSILQTDGIAHMSWPQAFFRTRSDAHMETVLGLSRPGELYGRRNVLVDGSRHLLAEVIEVLAPVSR
jgi:hypothetical protein